MCSLDGRFARSTVLGLMVVVAAARAAAAPAVSASVADARAALDAGHPAQAARIAERAVVADPENGDAHLVLGLARFRSGRYAEAVDAFEAAGHAARPIAAPVVAFNKGSALYRAGQLEAAELSFLAAARDPTLAAVAVTNAAWAALDGGQIDHARELLASAERQPRAAEIASVLEDLRRQIAEDEAALVDSRVRRPRAEARQALDRGDWTRAIAGYSTALREAEKLRRSEQERGELSYALGVAQYRAGRFEDARRSFDAAATLAPTEGEFHMMAAVSAARLDETAASRRGFEEAMRRELSPENAELIRSYLAALTPGLATRGEGVSVGAAVALGVDSNVAQTGIGRTETIANAGGSGFAEAALDLSWRFPVGARGHAELAYNFDQTAIFDSDLDQFSLQQHTAEATGELRVSPWLRLALLGGGDLLFSGLADFSAFQIGATVKPMLALDEGPRAITRVEVEHSWKHSLQTDFAHLSGTRTDVTVAQDLGSRRVRLTLAYRYRDEALPTPERISVVALANLGSLPQCQNDITCTYVIPYGYTAHAGTLRASLAMPSLGRLAVTASIEERDYSSNSYIDVLSAGQSIGSIYPRRRHDRRYGAGLALTLTAGMYYDATLRYDLLVSRSNIDDTAERLDYDNKNFTKHVVSLEVANDWLFRRR